MAKYSMEIKKEVVLAYLEGEGGYHCVAEKYNISNDTSIQKWVSAYKNFGDDGLKRSRQNKEYSFEFKCRVVELYLTSEKSYQELALEVGINNPSLIGKWIKDYNIAGPDALKPKRKGRSSKLREPDKKPNQTPEEKTEYLKQLEEENLKLRIENSYLKELRRLRLEEEALLRELQGSFTASEAHSN